MVCLLMGAAFVSTDGAFFAAHSADTTESDAETSSLARIKQIEAEIAKKHGALVYEQIVHNVSESAERNLGSNLHKISEKLGGDHTYVNNILISLSDGDNSRLFQTSYDMINAFYDDASQKIANNSSLLLEQIATSFYGMKSLFDIAAVGLGYKNLIIHLDGKNKEKFEQTKSVQTSLLQAANQEKESATRVAKATFDSLKEEIETTLKKTQEEVGSAIQGLENQNKAIQSTSRIPPVLVSKNIETIKRFTLDLAKAETDAEVKIKEATKVRDEAIAKAEKDFNEIKIKQEQELKKAEIEWKDGTKKHRLDFSWMIEPLGGGYGGKTLVRGLSGQYQSRNKYNYHTFNGLLNENPEVKLSTRLSLINAFLERGADSDMLYLMGVGDEEMVALRKVLQEESKKKLQQISSVASSSNSNGSAQKKSSK